MILKNYRQLAGSARIPYTNLWPEGYSSSSMSWTQYSNSLNLNQTSISIYSWKSMYQYGTPISYGQYMGVSYGMCQTTAILAHQIAGRTCGFGSVYGSGFNNGYKDTFNRSTVQVNSVPRWNMRIGGSNTEPNNWNRYALVTEITDGSKSFATSLDSNGDSKFTLTYQNTASVNRAVYEVALTCMIWTSAGNNELFLYRKVLDTPVAVAPGESATFTITWNEFNA